MSTYLSKWMKTWITPSTSCSTSILPRSSLAIKFLLENRRDHQSSCTWPYYDQNCTNRFSRHTCLMISPERIANNMYSIFPPSCHILLQQGRNWPWICQTDGLIEIWRGTRKIQDYICYAKETLFKLKTPETTITFMRASILTTRALCSKWKESSE